jgi:hypothetical protein
MQIFEKLKVNENQQIYVLASTIFFLKIFVIFSTIELENVGEMCFLRVNSHRYKNLIFSVV